MQASSTEKTVSVTPNVKDPRKELQRTWGLLQADEDVAAYPGPDQSIGQEDIAGPAALGDLQSHSNPAPGPAVREVGVADAEADQLGQSESGSQGQGDDQVVPGMSNRGLRQRPLLGGGREAGSAAQSGQR